MTVLILSSKKNKDRTKNLLSKNKKKQGNSPIGFEKRWARAFNGYRKPLAYFRLIFGDRFFLSRLSHQRNIPLAFHFGAIAHRCFQGIGIHLYGARRATVGAIPPYRLVGSFEYLFAPTVVNQKR